MDDNHLLNVQQLLEWYYNKNINPVTNRKIKESGKIYNSYQLQYEKIFPNGINFFDADSKDPVSLSEIWVERDGKKYFTYDNHDNLILYKDNKNFINCFEKETINSFIKNKITIHPVTYTDIPDNVFESIEYKEIVIEKTIKERALEVFQIFLNISIFIDFEEFLNLDNFKLGKLYYETQDFFHQNVNQSIIESIKEKGKKQNKQIYTLLVSEFDELNKEEQQKILLDSFEMLLTYENEELKSMSYYIILGGLSLFIPKIKEQYPDFCFSF